MCTLNRYISFQLVKACEGHDVSQCFVYIKNVCGGTILDNFLSCLFLKTQGEGEGGMIWENGIETCIIALPSGVTAQPAGAGFGESRALGESW